MITKIKNTVQSISKLKNILEGVVKVEATGDRIPNQYESNNMAGIYQAMLDGYGRPNFVTFTNDF
jgi:hypothetical protein